MNSADVTAEGEAKTEERSDDLSALGLGYGINGLHPTNLLSVVVRPVLSTQTKGSPAVFDEVLSQVGYSSFVNETYSKSKFTSHLQSSLSGGTPHAISLNLGANYGRKNYREQGRTEVGCQYVGREYRFRISSDASSSTKTEVESMIYNELGQREFSEVDDPKEIEKACIVVLKERLLGATHFVSSVELGAKIYEDVTRDDAKDSKSGGANVDVGAALFGGSKIGFSFTKENMNKAMQKRNRIRIIAGPSFLKKVKSSAQKDDDSRLCVDHSEILCVDREDEVVISRFVLPVGCLIRDLVARETMNRVGRKFLEESLRLVSPLLDRPLLLTVGCVKDSYYYFSLDDNLSVVLTHRREKATPVCLEIAPVKRFCLSRPAIPSDWASKTNVAFYISFIRGGRKYYMGMSSSMTELAAPRATSTPARAPRSTARSSADPSMSVSAPPPPSPHSSESSNIQRAEHDEVPPTLPTSRVSSSINLLQALFVAPSTESTPSPSFLPRAERVLEETAVFPDEKRCIGRLVVKSSWAGQDQERCQFYLHNPCSGLPMITLLSWVTSSLLCLHIKTGIFTESVFALVTMLKEKKPDSELDFQKVSAYFSEASVMSETVAEAQDYQRFCQYRVLNITTEEYTAAYAPRSDGSRGRGSSVRGSHH